MTRDAGVGCDDSKRTDGEAPQGAPYSTREAQFKYSSNRNVIQATLVV
jgi:hypothetical protein